MVSAWVGPRVHNNRDAIIRNSAIPAWYLFRLVLPAAYNYIVSYTTHAAVYTWLYLLFARSS